jgi:hypothetical protein
VVWLFIGKGNTVMTFNVQHKITGNTFIMYAKSIDHLWGLMLCNHGESGTRDHEVIGASHFGRVLWGTM